MRITFSLELPAEADSVPVVRALVRSSMGELGIVEDCVDDIALALTEACANVVAHATADGAEPGGDYYGVEISFDHVDCEIEVSDHGPGFEPSMAASGMPSWEAERGRGLAMIQALMDTVGFSSEPGAGTVVTFGKRLLLRQDSKLRPVAPPA